jgi:hypothetical protein
MTLSTHNQSNLLYSEHSGGEQFHKYGVSLPHSRRANSECAQRRQLPWLSPHLRHNGDCSRACRRPARRQFCISANPTIDHYHIEFIIIPST